LQEAQIGVIVGTVTDDVRLFDVPKLRVVALRFTETARARIVKVRCPGGTVQCCGRHRVHAASSSAEHAV
jgi:ribosomal protein L18E